MSERHYLGLYWADRKESIDAAVEQTQELFRAMGAIDPSLARWFAKGATREESLRSELTSSPELVREALRARQDVPGEELEPLGFYLDVWNGAGSGESILFHLTIGAHAMLDNCRAPNSLVLTLPADPASETGARLLSTARLTALMESLALSLAPAPDWGVVSTDKWMRSGALMREPGEPHVAWLTYLAARRGALPALPAGISHSAVGERGAIVRVGDGLFSRDDDDATERAVALEAALREAGLLGITER